MKAKSLRMGLFLIAVISLTLPTCTSALSVSGKVVRQQYVPLNPSDYSGEEYNLTVTAINNGHDTLHITEIKAFCPVMNSIIKFYNTGIKSVLPGESFSHSFTTGSFTSSMLNQSRAPGHDYWTFEFGVFSDGIFLGEAYSTQIPTSPEAVPLDSTGRSFPLTFDTRTAQ